VAVLSDAIEQFIKDMLGEQQTVLELKRSELAGHFGCAPSQINYVLATRFTPERGYVVESRRGGGGCIRIVCVRSEHRLIMSNLAYDKYIGGITEMQAKSIIAGLEDAGIASACEAGIMASAVLDRTLGGNAADRDRLRLDIMRSMTAALLKEDR